MPFLKHLGELRKRLTIVVFVLAISMVILYFFTNPIYRFVLNPVWAILKGGAPIAIGVLDPMTVRFGLAFWSAVVLTSPITIWQIMAFLLPALRERERRFVIPTFAAMVVLFIAGIALCYTVILPASFGWLADQAGTVMRFMPQAGDMLAVVEFFLLAFGLAFQLPVVIFYLVYFGVVPYRKLRRSWRTAYLVIAATASLVTPDWSPVTMIALAVAMIILYEGTMALCRVTLNHRIQQQDEEAAGDLEEA
jgi:sec-independent protein translocase protein TatC